MLANFTVDAGVNLTNFLQHRQKRHLIYPQGASIKLIVGPIFPLPLQDLFNCLVFYNVHMGDYPLTSNLMYSNNFVSKSFVNDDYSSHKTDKTREFFYQMLEYFIDSQIGVNLGHSCLLKLICQNAQIHHHMNLFGDILNVILTPGKEHLNEDYIEAYNLGKMNVNCVKRYNICSQHITFLDQIIDDDF